MFQSYLKTPRASKSASLSTTVETVVTVTRSPTSERRAVPSTAVTVHLPLTAGGRSDLLKAARAPTTTTTVVISPDPVLD